MTIDSKAMLDKMKETAANVASGAADMASSVVKSAGDMVELNKMNAAISAEKKKIEKLYTEIGEKCYQTAGDTIDKATFREQLKAIDAGYEAIKEMMEKSAELRRKKVCPNCGRECSMESAFCAACGTKLPEITEEGEGQKKLIENCCTCGKENCLTQAENDGMIALV